MSQPTAPEIRSMAPGDVPAVAALHAAALPGLLQQLGPKVIGAFYAAALRLPDTVALAAGHEPLGFAFGTTQSSGYYRRVALAAPSLALRLALALLRRPAMLRGGQPAAGPELLYLAVAPEARGQGLGQALVRAFAEELRRREFESFELSVNADNDGAVAFYRALGFEQLAEFEEFGFRRVRFRWAPADRDQPSPQPAPKGRGSRSALPQVRLSGAAVTISPQPLSDEASWAAWDRFVVDHPNASFAHLSGHLLTLHAATGYRLQALTARDGERILGLLPWVRTRSGRAISLPFYEYGGPLVAADAPAETAAALVAAAGPIELRLAGGWRGPELGLTRIDLGELAVLDLDGDVEAGYDRSLRKALRCAERLGVEVHRVMCPSRLVGDFYPAYLRWMRDRHGTPPLSRRYFELVAWRLRGHWQLFESWHQGRVVARLLGFAVGRNVAITAIVSDRADGELRGVDAAHAAFVRWAAERGCARFEFGAVRYEGQRRYKLKFGCRLAPFELLGGHLPASPEGPAARLARGCWRQLPLSVTARCGPALREWLTW